MGEVLLGLVMFGPPMKTPFSSFCMSVIRHRLVLLLLFLSPKVFLRFDCILNHKPLKHFTCVLEKTLGLCGLGFPWAGSKEKILLNQ
jgi:hypothetical protein